MQAGQRPQGGQALERRLPELQSTQNLTLPIDEATARRIIAELQLFVQSQQKDRARELIRQYPNTRLAEIAQRLLDQYELYDRARALEQRLAKTHSLRIRAFWDARRLPHLPARPPLIQITNRADEALMYQVKLYETEWLGPYRLRPGETDTFNSCLLYRRLTEDGAQLHTLRPGSEYVFVKPTPEARPQLFKSR